MALKHSGYFHRKNSIGLLQWKIGSYFFTRSLQGEFHQNQQIHSQCQTDSFVPLNQFYLHLCICTDNHSNCKGGWKLNLNRKLNGEQASPAIWQKKMVFSNNNGIEEKLDNPLTSAIPVQVLEQLLHQRHDFSSFFYQPISSTTMTIEEWHILRQLWWVAVDHKVWCYCWCFWKKMLSWEVW